MKSVTSTVPLGVRETRLQDHGTGTIASLDRKAALRRCDQLSVPVPWSRRDSARLAPFSSSPSPVPHSQSLIAAGARSSGAHRGRRIVQGEQGTVKHHDEDHPWLRLRLHRPLVRRAEERCQRHRRPDAICCARRSNSRPRRDDGTAGSAVHAGETIPCTLSWYPSHQTEPAAYDAIIALNETTAYWEGWSSRHEAKSEWREAELPLARDAEGTHVQADRRHHRGAHDLAAGTTGRRAQLGLSLLLAAGRDFHLECAAAGRLRQGGDSLARMAAARGGGLAAGSADSVRRDGRAPPG